jgi:hypothetical protein
MNIISVWCRQPPPPLKSKLNQKNKNFVDTLISVVITDFLFGQNEPLKLAEKIVGWNFEN